MFYGTIMRMPDDVNVNRLHGVKWEREERGYQLKNVVKLKPDEIPLVGGRKARVGWVIGHSIGVEKSFDEDQDGQVVLKSDEVVKTDWAYVYFAPSLLLVDRKDNTVFVRDTLNKGLRRPKNSVRHVYLDTRQMKEDHPNQWFVGFSERNGHVKRGRLYGESIEKDVVFDGEVRRSKDREVGWETDFFGSRTKFKVSTYGSFTLMANIIPERVLRFIETQILPYEISIPI